MQGEGPIYLSDGAQQTLMPGTSEILDMIEEGIRLTADPTSVTLPATSLRTRSDRSGALYTIRGTCPALNLSMVKTVAAFPENRAVGLSPDMGIATFYEAHTGRPVAILEARTLTRYRTAALVAWAALKLSSKNARSVGVIGARGIAALATSMMLDLRDLAEIGFASNSFESASDAASKINERKPGVARAAASTPDAIRGADIVLDGPGLTRDELIAGKDDLARGMTWVAFGAFSSVTADFCTAADAVIADRWDENATGALGPAIAEGMLDERSLRTTLPEMVAQGVVGRRSDAERLVVMLRGLAICDITLARALIRKAEERGDCIRLP